VKGGLLSQKPLGKTQGGLQIKSTSTQKTARSHDNKTFFIITYEEAK
jgi:hypothetical protein